MIFKYFKKWLMEKNWKQRSVWLLHPFSFYKGKYENYGNYLIGVPEEGKKDNGTETVFEGIYGKRFSKLKEDILSIHESRSSTNLKQDNYKEKKL